MTALFVNVNDDAFTLNGIVYDKIYIALPAGVNSVKVVCAYEHRNVILPATPYSDVQIDGNTYGNVTALIAALKGIVYKMASGEGGGGSSNVLTVTISGRVFRLIKGVGNSLETQEINDIIEGYAPNGDFIYAVYLGGNTADFSNTAVYNNVNGFEI